MGKAQHLIKNSHVGHYTIHTVVVVTRKQLLSNSLENKKCLFGRKPIVYKEGNYGIHALAITDVWVILSKYSQYLLCFGYNLRAFISTLNIFLYIGLEVSGKLKLL
jgi:hypothetical protein